MLILKPREEGSRLMLWLSPFFAVFVMWVFGGVMFWVLGLPVLEGLGVFFLDPLLSLRGWSELLLKAIPLALCGLGLSFGFRAGIWNIGAEGQLLMGALGGSVVALYFYEVEGFWVLVLVLLGGVLGGMLWGLIPALLKTWSGASEILTSLMLTYVAGLFLSAMVHGPLRDPDGYNFPESRLFSDSSLVPILWEGTRLHWGFVVMLVLAFLLWLVMSRHRLGYWMNVCGGSSRAALYAGVDPKKMVVISFLISGGFAGLAGAFEVSGSLGQLVPVVSPGYGFTGIIVAFLGGLHPLGVVVGSLVLSLTYIGGENAQIAMNMPSAVTGVFQGALLLFLLACRTLESYRLVWRR
jgi:simple sugar transport system permease protein